MDVSLSAQAQDQAGHTMGDIGSGFEDLLTVQQEQLTDSSGDLNCSQPPLQSRSVDFSLSKCSDGRATRLFTCVYKRISGYTVDLFSGTSTTSGLSHHLALVACQHTTLSKSMTEATVRPTIGTQQPGLLFQMIFPRATLGGGGLLPGIVVIRRRFVSCNEIPEASKSLNFHSPVAMETANDCRRCLAIPIVSLGTLAGRGNRRYLL